MKPIVTYLIFSSSILLVLAEKRLPGLACDASDVFISSRDSHEDHWKDIPGQENIVQVNETNFDEFTKQRSFIHFWNDWCHVFKDARESIAKIASALKEENYPGAVGAFQCLGVKKENEKPICVEAEKDCWKYNIYYYDGKLVEHYPWATVDYESSAIRFMKAHISKPSEKVYGRRC